VPESEQNKEVQARLSERIETHRKEAQSLLKQGGEQAQYEFKRFVALGRDNLDDRLDFIKFVQAVANAELSTDRCIVIGGDPREKKFYPVTNIEEFDAANLSKILGIYLDPMPLFQSYKVSTDDGVAFVLIVLEQNQPRPIVVIKQGQTEKGKTRLEEGDVWIKKNTDTVRAKRTDIDLMYKLRNEEEAEDKARKRLAHFLDLNPPARSVNAPTTLIPTFSLLVGPKNEFRTFVVELIGTNDQRGFNMLLEVCRETLVEGWDNADVSSSQGNFVQFFENLNDFQTNRFLPALDSVIDQGLLVIKHNADPRWLGAVVDLLEEAFNACQRLVRFQVYGGTKEFPYYWWRPAFETYIGIRAIAAYAVLRNRLPFLGMILPRTVTRVTANQMYRDIKTPIVFWPFAALPFVAGELAEGRAQYFWSERVAAAWGTYFGNLNKFVEASSQLELLLEFNSSLGTNQPKLPQLQEWVANKNEADVTFEYVPDLYAQDLQATVPMAERLYEILASGGLFPSFLTVDPQLPLVAFGNLKGPQRLEIYGGFLHKLKVWQSEYRCQAFHAWEFMWDWQGRLKKIAQAFADSEKAKKPNTTVIRGL
jgi:hypothetical protein